MTNYKHWEAKLKPCPFCAGDRIRILPQEYGISVNCEICYAKKDVIWPGCNMCIWSLQQAVGSWNMRRTAP